MGRQVLIQAFELWIVLKNGRVARGNHGGVEGEKVHRQAKQRINSIDTKSTALLLIAPVTQLLYILAFAHFVRNHTAEACQLLFNPPLPSSG